MLSEAACDCVTLSGSEQLPARHAEPPDSLFLLYVGVAIGGIGAGVVDACSRTSGDVTLCRSRKVLQRQLGEASSS